MPEALQHFLHVAGLLWLRCAPLFFLAPYLAVGLRPSLGTAFLSWAFAGALTPIALAGSVSTAVSWQLIVRELTVGLVIGLSLGLPCAVFRTTGAIAQGLAGSNAAAESDGGQLGRLAGLVALVAIASAGAFAGAAELLLSTSPPLSAAKAPALELLRPLADQLLRAFELGVSLCGPLLLAAVFAALALGFVGRVAGAQLSSAGPALVPWLGIALVSLCVANWLDSLPELVRAFARNTAKLLE